MALTGSLIRPVWHDELYTLALARMPLADLLAALRTDSGPPLHYLVCHLLFAIVGWHEGSAFGTFMVRLPSVLAYTMMPWVLWRWARERGPTFFWAALLTIAWLPMLYFATEARAYALLALVNAVLWLLGPELITKRRCHLVLFSALAAALPMLHYAGFVSFCFLPVIALFIPRSCWRSLAAALGAAAVPMVAWSPVILGAPIDSMRWVDTSAGPGRPGIASIEALSPAGPFPALFEVDTSPVPAALSIAVLIVMLTALVFGAARTLRGRNQESELGKTITRLAIGLLPVVALGCLVLIGPPVYFAGRTESMVWSLLASLVAASTLAAPRTARWAMLAPYAVLGFVTTALWIGGLPSRPDAIGVQIGRELAGVLRPNDRVVVVGLWQLEVRHGLAEVRDGRSPGANSTSDVETLPRSQSMHPGWFDLKAATTPALLQEAIDLRREAESEGSRMWLVWSPALPVERTVLPAFSSWRRDSVVASPVITVDLLAPPSVADAEGSHSTH